MRRLSGDFFRAGAARAAASGIVVSTLGLVVGGAPEVSSEAWCEDMKAKPRGDWTASEATDFAKSCVFRVKD